jgi:sugar/nucleoside kinase (ribokinase family)
MPPLGPTPTTAPLEGRQLGGLGDVGGAVGGGLNTAVAGAGQAVQTAVGGASGAIETAANAPNAAISAGVGVSQIIRTPASRLTCTGRK